MYEDIVCKFHNKTCYEHLRLVLYSHYEQDLLTDDSRHGSADEGDN